MAPVVWYGLLAVWWFGSVVGVIRAAQFVQEAKRRGDGLPPEWKWSRTIVARQVSAGRTRGITFTAMFVAASVRVGTFNIDPDGGFGRVVTTTAPLWFLMITNAIWAGTGIILLVMTERDLRRAQPEINGCDDA